jgi:hypothetical protein
VWPAAGKSSLSGFEIATSRPAAVTIFAERASRSGQLEVRKLSLDFTSDAYYHSLERKIENAHRTTA